MGPHQTSIRILRGRLVCWKYASWTLGKVHAAPVARPAQGAVAPSRRGRK